MCNRYSKYWQRVQAFVVSLSSLSRVSGVGRREAKIIPRICLEQGREWKSCSLKFRRLRKSSGKYELRNSVIYKVSHSRILLSVSMRFPNDDKGMLGVNCVRKDRGALKWTARPGSGHTDRSRNPGGPALCIVCRVLPLWQSEADGPAR